MAVRAKVAKNYSRFELTLAPGASREMVLMWCSRSPMHDCWVYYIHLKSAWWHHFGSSHGSQHINGRLRMCRETSFESSVSLVTRSRSNNLPSVDVHLPNVKTMVKHHNTVFPIASWMACGRQFFFLTLRACMRVGSPFRAQDVKPTLVYNHFRINVQKSFR